MNWLWDSFLLVSPWYDQFIPWEYVQGDGFSYRGKIVITETYLSRPAQALLMHWDRPEIYTLDPTVFELQTLNNIISMNGHNYQSNDIYDLGEYIEREIIGQQYGDIYPIQELFQGFLVANNWRYLSNLDILKFATAWGVQGTPVHSSIIDDDQILEILQGQAAILTEQMKNNYIKGILRRQNSLLREIYEIGWLNQELWSQFYTINVDLTPSTLDNLSQLLQNM